MNILNMILAQAAGGGSSMGGILMIVAMIVIFYFFMIRPQQKKQKELKKQREALAPGDKVVTAGGIHGVIRQKDENTMIIEIDEGVRIRVDKNSVYALPQEQPSATNK